MLFINKISNEECLALQYTQTSLSQLIDFVGLRSLQIQSGSKTLTLNKGVKIRLGDFVVLNKHTKKWYVVPYIPFNICYTHMEANRGFDCELRPMPVSHK